MAPFLVGPLAGSLRRVPGLKRDDVHVELNGNELCVSREIKQEDTGNALRRRTGTIV
ncbi:Hsp20/alpha crystallin family protein [Nonomuraea sp. B19D2]|uniref:Hsp20/alpha crystallin family protein n=1 Tax=Nonomuraea sp. B19D2 TaxID=3159561 RepID=UPI0032DB90A2